jgi:hypothetical protein
MAFDLLFRTETDADWSRSTDETKPLPLEFSPVEGKTLKLLEPSTATFAVALLSWARGKGIPAKLTATAIYTPKQSVEYKDSGKSSVSPGLDWHNVGRAFHLGIFLPGGDYDAEAYARVGLKARELGGEWLGDKPLKVTNKKTGKKSILYDTAHFEYHPLFDLKTYRSMPLAQAEFNRAQEKAKRYT